MNHLSRRTVLLSAVAGPAVARAQTDFPNRSIRLVIPWPPGVSANAFLRSIADQAGKRLGQTAVPDNKPGANATLSALALKDAVMEKFSMPTLYLDGAGYAATYRELEGVERANLKRVGMLAKQG